MFKIILLGLIIAFGLIAFGSATPVSTTTSSTAPSTYGQCLNDANTQFMVGVYKQKYPGLSNSQIEHTLCKDK